MRRYTTGLPVIIRPATDADRPILEAFAKAAWDERGYDAGPVPWEALSLSTDTLALIAEADQPIGCFVAALARHPLSGQPYADQMLWYVVPSKRGTAAGPRLLLAFREACRARGIREARLIQPVARPRLARFFRRHACEPIETAWRMRISP